MIAVSPLADYAWICVAGLAGAVIVVAVSIAIWRADRADPRPRRSPGQPDEPRTPARWQ